MGLTTFWVLMPLSPDDVERFAPLIRPPLAEHAALPRVRELRERWERGQSSEPEFFELAAAYPLDEHIEAVYEAWDAGHRAGPHFHTAARKAAPIAALAHAFGSNRFSRLPGWFGDFLLDPAEVKAALPAVEAAFDLGEARRAEALAALGEVMVECRRGEPEEFLAGVVPVWRAAAEAGQGLIGTQVTPT